MFLKLRGIPKIYIPIITNKTANIATPIGQSVMVFILMHATNIIEKINISFSRYIFYELKKPPIKVYFSKYDLKIMGRGFISECMMGELNPFLKFDGVYLGSFGGGGTFLKTSLIT